MKGLLLFAIICLLASLVTGFLAASHLLAPHGVRAEPVFSIPRRGILGRRPVETEASRMR